MEHLDTISVISNFMIVIGGMFFTIALFGRKSPTIESLPFLEKWSIKAALSITVTGSLFNLIYLVTPPISEILLNFGLGCVFIWGAFFHFKYFVWKDKDHGK